jgi:hypothetical protein
MSFHSWFYRSLFYFHALIAVSEFILIIALFILIFITKPELFFKIKHPDDENWELIGMKNWIIMMSLFIVGIFRTVILFFFIFGILGVSSYCCFLLCFKCFREAIYKLFKAKATHRFISFNCNCPCYRARPKLRFQLQFLFLILVSGIRIATIAFCLSLQHHITTKSLAVIVAISFFFLVLTSLLDYYHYRMWWRYKPDIIKLKIAIPTTPLSNKHKRYLPYQLLGSNRTGQHGDKLCSNKRCKIRKLEHILIFHLSDYQPQPRWSEVKEFNPSADTYIGFHRTSAQSALLIAHSDFRRSTNPPQMLGFGIYFARSIKNTLGKARFEGAVIAAEIRMGNVKEVSQNELNTVRNTDRWHPEFDTVYYNHENDQRDEFCIYDESQILKWIIVIDEQFDRKSSDYGMDREFDDTKCYCI